MHRCDKGRKITICRPSERTEGASSCYLRQYSRLQIEPLTTESDKQIILGFLRNMRDYYKKYRSCRNQIKPAILELLIEAYETSNPIKGPDDLSTRLRESYGISTNDLSLRRAFYDIGKKGEKYYLDIGSKSPVRMRTNCQILVIKDPERSSEGDTGSQIPATPAELMVEKDAERPQQIKIVAAGIMALCQQLEKLCMLIVQED